MPLHSLRMSPVSRIPTRIRVFLLCLCWFLLLSTCCTRAQMTGDGGPDDGDDSDSSSSSCTSHDPIDISPLHPSATFNVAANSWMIPVFDYLNEYIQLGGRVTTPENPLFDPPLTFVRQNHGPYFFYPVEKSQSPEEFEGGYDFFLQNAYRSACVESEHSAVNLATMKRPFFLNGEKTTETKFGAVLYALKERDDILTVSDVKDQRVATNRITSLATHLCFDLMIRHGVQFIQDPKQIIFTRNSKEALEAVLDGKVDVGCAATGTLETYIDEMTGEAIDWESKLRILDRQDDITEEDGSPFPLVLSTPLVPSYPLLALPHVPAKVQLAVQETLLQIEKYSQVAVDVGLVSCVDLEECRSRNDTSSCIDACWNTSLLNDPSCPIFETTARQALAAYDALEQSGIEGFTKPISNLIVRDMQEKTGFLIKDDNPFVDHGRCVRFDSLVDAVSCPPGQFVRSTEEIQNSCNATGLECYGPDSACVCKPCVEAFEVDVTTMDLGFEANIDDFPVTVPARKGDGCSKFEICGIIQQKHTMRIYASDNVGRANATVTGAFLSDDGDRDLIPFEFSRTSFNGTDVFHYDYELMNERVGVKIFKVFINEEEIPESPFRLLVEESHCGDNKRIPDEFGDCVCAHEFVEMGESCVSLKVLLPSVLVPFAVFVGIVIWVYLEIQRKKSDAVWKIKPEELRFDEDPPILGRGTFGVVLLSEYRGTPVAVKRVMPRSTGVVEAPLPSDGSNDKVSPIMLKTIFDKQTITADKDSQSTDPQVLNMGIMKESFTQSRMAKKFGTKRTSSLNSQRDFTKEMRLLSKLRHPNIVTIMGAVEMVDESMMVMEYMHFGSLHQLLRNESLLPEPFVLIRMIIEVANGLRYLHSAKPQVIHGDLNSKNILVDERFRAKVSDFGLAGYKGSYGSKHATGTPLFMAPELIRGVSGNTASSDVYSFGMVIYEVFSRKDPFEGEHDDDLLRLIASKTTSKRPQVPADMPKDIQDLMIACWETEPADRPQAAEIDIRLRMVGLNEESIDTGPGDRKLQRSVRPSRQPISRQYSSGHDTTLASAKSHTLSTTSDIPAMLPYQPGLTDRNIMESDPV